MNLENKTVFITGGTSGYGKAAAKEDGICADFIKMDVTVPSDWERACGYMPYAKTRMC